MKKILVTGANGQLGSELRVLAKKHTQFEWVFADRTKITLDNLDLLQKQLEDIDPNIILNCGAYTAVDKAETEQELVFLVNHLAVELIAKFTSANNAKLVHVSTDYVFDGNSSVALYEEAETKPINVYGDSKRAGEIACLKENPNSIIIRTSWVYSEFGNNFVKTILRLMKERGTVSIVNDQIGSPTYAADLAQVILTILNSGNWEPGIYHYSNEGEISWFDFANDIKEIVGLCCVINGIPSSAYLTAAARPSFSLLDKNKIKLVYGIEVPDYKKSLKTMLSRL